MLLTPARPQSLGLRIALIAYAPPSSMPRLCTRQGAHAFNQTLSFNTSSVTSMDYLFWVRLRACPCHPPTSRAHAARHLGHRPHALPSPGPPAALSACLPLDSAGRASVQPAAELRHVPRHDHVLHVSGAAPRLPVPPTHQSGPRRASLRPSRPRPSVSRPARRPLSLPSFGLGRARPRLTSR